MTKEFIVVWRAAEGAAVQTYALPSKAPRVFTDSDTDPEVAEAEWIDNDALAVLLENREAFHPKRVDKKTANALLGWSV